MTDIDPIELNIIDKVKNYFDINDVLTNDKLIDFLDYISLSDVFGTDEDMLVMWTIFTNINQAHDKNNEEVDYETAKEGILEIFEYYGINLNEELTNNTSLNDKTVDFSTPVKSNEETRISMLNRESVSSKKLDDLLTKISVKRSNDKVSSKFNVKILKINFLNNKSF